MEIQDIHTHIMPQEPGSALICIGSGPLPENAEGHFFSAGLHPWDVTGQDEEPFGSIEKLLALPQVLAVGECGFDTLRGPVHELQEKAFVRQCELSERFRKPMILHVVRDFDSIIHIRKMLNPTQPWLIHGFRGGIAQMSQLYSQGILVSFGQRHNPETLKQVPSNRLFLETDGKCPIDDVILVAASLRSESPETITQNLKGNTESFLLQEQNYQFGERQ